MISTFDKIPATIEELIEIKEKNYLSASEVIVRLYELKREASQKVEIPPYKSKPKSPDKMSTSKEIREYANELEEWEKYDKERNKAIKKSERAGSNVPELLEDFIKIESGLTTKVPEKYRDKVYSYAWERGHSCGYSEVYIHLCDLVNIFQ
jgi:hypothetical protein